jgi:hypothetical protein
VLSFQLHKWLKATHSLWFLFTFFLLIISSSLSATTYYVDAQNGSDANTGTSEISDGRGTGPWQTVTKVNNTIFSPGDSILFKRGDTWTGQALIPKNGGSPGGTITIQETILSQPLQFQLVDPNNNNCIYFGAYGDGNKPKLNCIGGDGLVLEHNYIIVEDLHLDNGGNGMLSFERIGGNYWNVVKNIDVTNSLGNAVRFDEGGSNCWLDGLNVYDYIHNGIYLNGSPANPLSKVLVENCHVENSFEMDREDAISCHREDNTHNIAGDIIIRNNHIIRSGEDGIDITSGTNILVEGNAIEHSMSAGIFVAKPSRVHTVEVRGNYLNSNSISKGNGDLTAKTNNVRVVNNIIVGTGHHSLHLGTATDVEIWNNVIAPVNRTGNFIRLRDSLEQIDIRNNIFDFTRTDQEINGDLSPVTLDYNCYFTNSPNQDVFSAGTLSEVQALNPSIDANGIQADPGFLNLERTAPDHFRLLENSPCLDIGDNISLPTDYWGTQRPQGNGIDLGIYEADGTTCSDYQGLPCNDLNACTINDVYDADCNCIGVIVDSDGDGICDLEDNCPNTPNSDQSDSDGDYIGNVCDNCPNDANNDLDGDGICGDVDNCPNESNPGQEDEDGNGVGNVCEIFADAITLEVRVSNSNDDAEQRQSGGNVSLTSTDLELVYDGSKGNQTIGMRFNNISIPQSAVIKKAYIQFTTDEVSSESTTLKIEGEAIDHALAFTSADYGITNRSRTSQFVNWNPLAWITKGEAGIHQKTPDIKEIIQEIIGITGWANGNSMVILVSGTGKRVAESYDGVPESAALLHIEYVDESCSMTGTACNDNNLCTQGDVYDEHCNCVGVFQDADGDGVCDAEDVCPNGDDNQDADGDGFPDVCDICPNSAIHIDSDGDRICDENDVCPGFNDFDDADWDGVPDGCDVCPGFDDNIDSDGDGIPNGCDNCQGDDTSDTDGDGTPDACDICPGFDDNVDLDGDGIPDACDVCPGFDDKLDADGDGVPDACDVCLGFDDSIDTDGDGNADGCDACPGFDDAIDTDADGIADGCDACPGFDDAVDTDGDGIPDDCDVCPGFDDKMDADGDGVPDACDICPGFDDNIDSDGDGNSDGCDACPGFDDAVDTDGDGVADGCDACPGFNDSVDSDGDGIPDDCDDLGCTTVTNYFPEDKLRHTGSGSSSIELNFGGMHNDVVFTISDINQKTDGKKSRRFIEIVTVEYVDNQGTLQYYDSFSGSNSSSVEIAISVEVLLVRITLEDGYDGSTSSQMSITLGPVSSCDPGYSCDDSDDDGVCDMIDICPGFDDNLDEDGDGTPDGCETDKCNSVTNHFSESTLTHSGGGSSDITLELGGIHRDVSFTISDIMRMVNGKPENRYSEQVIVEYDDGTGSSTLVGIYDGSTGSTVPISIPGNVQALTITLQDGYDGEAPIELNVDLSPVNSCEPSSAMINDVIVQPNSQNEADFINQDEIRLFPNPSDDLLNIVFNLHDPTTLNLIVTDVNGISLQNTRMKLESGLQTSIINVSHLPAGIYFIHMGLNDQRISKKFAIIR